MGSPIQPQGVLRVVGGADLTASEQASDAAKAAALKSTAAEIPGLSAFITNQFQMMRRHRDDANSGWSNRLMQALRAFNGQYDPSQVAEIAKFGGSDVYARIIAVKCRGASSLLRDVYLGADRAWSLSPDPDPQVPQEILDTIQQLVQHEIQGLMQAQQPPPDPASLRDRVNGLVEGARQACKQKADKQAKIAEDKIEEILTQGGFYKALAEFIVDLPLFPYACMKGPVVKIVPDVVWKNGRAITLNKARLFWQRISPFDVYWTPGVSNIADASMIERSRLTRADLNDLLDLPGYDEKAVRGVLADYGRGGLSDNWDQTDAERAVYESRENPQFNQSGMIACLEFQGHVQGDILLEAGLPPEVIPDPLRDYFVQAWMIGRYIIKVQLAPSPRKRHQYYITSFEKVPGTVVGNGLPDILADVQTVCNATLRALVNNLSISSGPQVVVNDDRLSDDEDGENLYPWKRWHVTSDPMGNNTQPPISFFQPSSNSQELSAVYTLFSGLADELSAVPKYMTGSGAGAAGRTASGLSMLMSNASKILQTVAANVDLDIMEGVLGSLFDMLMLTDTSGLLTGEEEITVMGVNVALQKETQRSRQLEFLQGTMNPVDMQIMGPRGRANILRPIADGLGLPGAQIVPTDEDMAQQQAQAKAMAAQQGQPGHGGMGEQAANGQGTQSSSPVTKDQGPRTNIVGGH